MYSLPLFPLDTVLFPGTPIHLHIFEERYKSMINQVLESTKTFGVALIHRGVEALGPVAEPHKVGCTAKIAEVERFRDGRMNLVCIGEELFRIRELDYRFPYLTGQVETFITEQPRTLDIVRGANRMNIFVAKYLKMISSISAQNEQGEDDLRAYLNQIKVPEDPTLMLYMACALLHIPSIEKQGLLETASFPDLYTKVLRIYKRELAVNLKLLTISEDNSRKLAWLN